MGRGAGAVMRWPWMGRVAEMSRPRMAAQVRWVCENWVRVRVRVMLVSGRIVLWQAVVGLMGRRLMEGRRPGVLKRTAMVVRIIRMRSLALLGRMRLL